MRKILVVGWWLVVVGLLIARPARAAGGDIYILIGASNAAEGSAARAIEELTGGTVVNCGKNGSGLVHWQAGGTLYEDCMAKYQTIAATGTLRGIFFINGEYESKYGGAWREPFTSLVASLRSDLGDGLPMAFVRVHPRMPGFYTARVYQEQTETIIPGVAMVTTDDLFLPRRAWHYRSAELWVIGERLVDAP